MLKKSLLLCSLILSGCVDDEPSENLDYPVLQNDVAEINLRRGDYSCYQMQTNFGGITLALDNYYAPSTSDNFDTYVMAGFYNGLIFHRVIDGFMIQGGGFNDALQRQETLPAIKAESKNGLKNYRGRIAMARTTDPHSATSQFFINTVDNHGLNYGKASDGWGYTVFGGVIDGMDTVDAISDVETGTISGFGDLPLEPVIIEQVDKITCPTE